MQSLKTDVFRKLIILACILFVLPVFSNAIEIPGLKLKYGKLERSREVTKKFETYQILPNHKYYFRGAKSRPTVIVGINETYELNLKLWVPVDPNSEDFRVIIDRVSLQGMGRAVEPWGFRILDPAGNDVGVWYSALSNAAVQINEKRQITNLQPSRTVAIGDQR